MKRVKVTMLLTDEDYVSAERIAVIRGVSFTEAVRGAIATEKYMRDAQKAGGHVLIEDRCGCQKRIEFD